MDDWWRQPLTDLVAGRRVILAGGVAAGWTPDVELLRALGAESMLVVATEGRGAGPQPDADVVAVDTAATDPMGRIRESLRTLADPPAEVRAALDRFDPDRRAVTLGYFLNESPTLAGRPFLAHRRREWVALEDKTIIDELFDRAGVAHAPSIVMPIEDATAARHQLDRGAGTVWAADATAGFHGGSAGTRWIVTDDDAARAIDDLSSFASHVRVMPFLDGIATSIHGVVLPDGVAVLRPIELVTLRAGRHLEYSGCASFWDPPADVREEMRGAARRVGEQLRAEVDFRGAFTIDGVATAEGFRPTELNPRFGAGFGVMTRAMPDVPVLLILDLIVAGRPLAITAAELEDRLLTVADAHRGGGTWNISHGVPATAWGRGVAFDGEGWRWSGDDEEAHGTVVGSKTFTRITFEPDHTPVGPSVGPRAAAFWNFLDAEFALGLGVLVAPPDVLSGSSETPSRQPRRRSVRTGEG